MKKRSSIILIGILTVLTLNACKVPRSGLVEDYMFRIQYSVWEDSSSNSYLGDLKAVKLVKGSYGQEEERIPPGGDFILTQSDRKGNKVHQHVIKHPMISFVSYKTDSGIFNTKVFVVRKELYVNIPIYTETRYLKLEVISFEDHERKLVHQSKFKARREVRSLY
jgi:hypothetical protein